MRTVKKKFQKRDPKDALYRKRDRAPRCVFDTHEKRDALDEDGESLNRPLDALTLPAHVDPVYFVAAHEAGHAVAFILAHRALGRNYASFDRVLIRRDFSSPYTDRRNREISCSGLCEAPSLYTCGIDLLAFSQAIQLPPRLKATILANMEWSMIISFAGPFAEAWSRNHRSRSDKRSAALFCCGGSEDYRQAETVLADYKIASKRRYGIRHFEERAWELVLASQPAISALASKLLQYESLDYEEVHKIVAPFLGARDAGRSSMNWSPRPQGNRSTVGSQRSSCQVRSRGNLKGGPSEQIR